MFEYFYQTSCLGILIFSIRFLGQSVTIKRQLVPFECFSEISGIMPSIKILFVYSQFSR